MWAVIHTAQVVIAAANEAERRLHQTWHWLISLEFHFVSSTSEIVLASINDPHHPAAFKPAFVPYMLQSLLWWKIKSKAATRNRFALGENVLLGLGREEKTQEVLTATLIAVSGFQASLVKPPRWTVWLTYRDWSPLLWYLEEEVGDVKAWTYCERWKPQCSPWSIMNQRKRQGRKAELRMGGGEGCRKRAKH